MPGDGVHREIPPGQIFQQGLGELHHGMAAEGLHVLSETWSPPRGFRFPGEDPHRPVLHPNGYGPGKELPDHPRGSPGGQIPVPGWETQEGVPDGATHRPGLVPCLLQGLGNPPNVPGRPAASDPLAHQDRAPIDVQDLPGDVPGQIGSRGIRWARRCLLAGGTLPIGMVRAMASFPPSP